MNKNIITPCICATRSNQSASTKQYANRTRGQTSEYHSLYGRRYGMAGYFTPILDTEDTL